jgi:hypothetical protein
MPLDAAPDPYARSAEFYDVMAAPHWSLKRESLVSALRAAPVTEPVVDIGAGSGLSTATIVDTLDRVDIHAIEPSAAMRSALVSRLLAHPGAAERVTVHADRVENVDLPPRLGAVVMMGVIGYLDPGARDEFWTRIRARLTPAAPIVVEFMPLTTPMPVPEMLIAQQVLGHRTAEVRIAGDPASATAERWTMRYSVRERDTVIRDFTTEHVWETIGIDDLRLVAARHHLTCEQVGPVIAVLRPLPSPPTGRGR